MGPQYHSCHFQVVFHERVQRASPPSTKPRGENTAGTHICCTHNHLHTSHSIFMLPMSFFHPLSVQQVRQQKGGCRHLESAGARRHAQPRRGVTILFEVLTRDCHPQIFPHVTRYSCCQTSLCCMPSVVSAVVQVQPETPCAGALSSSRVPIKRSIGVKTA